MQPQVPQDKVGKYSHHIVLSNCLAFWQSISLATQILKTDMPANTKQIKQAAETLGLEFRQHMERLKTSNWNEDSFTKGMIKDFDLASELIAA